MRDRWSWVVGAVLGAGLVLGGLAGCGLSWSGDDSGRLREGIDELASVGGPDGQRPTEVRVLGCDDEAEMPMGIATFAFDGPDDPRDVDASNAAWEELSRWYEARWRTLGWKVQQQHPQVSKDVGGKRLRAAVDAVTTDRYSVIVVRDGAGLCS